MEDCSISVKFWVKRKTCFAVLTSVVLILVPVLYLNLTHKNGWGLKRIRPSYHAKILHKPESKFTYASNTEIWADPECSFLTRIEKYQEALSAFRETVLNTTHDSLKETFFNGTITTSIWG